MYSESGIMNENTPVFATGVFQAGGRGFEPRHTDPESAVLPLDEPPVIVRAVFYHDWGICPRGKQKILDARPVFLRWRSHQGRVQFDHLCIDQPARLAPQSLLIHSDVVS